MTVQKMTAKEIRKHMHGEHSRRAQAVNKWRKRGDFWQMMSWASWLATVAIGVMYVMGW